MSCPLHQPVDWGVQAHTAAERHLDACDAWLAYFDDDEPAGERPAGGDPSSAPYCGCQTCLIREVLHAAWPVLEEAIRSGDLDAAAERPCTCPAPPPGPPQLRVVEGED